MQARLNIKTLTNSHGEKSVQSVEGAVLHRVDNVVGEVPADINVSAQEAEKQ